MTNLVIRRDSADTAGVGSPEMTEAERRIAGVVTWGVVSAIDYSDTANPVVRVGIGDAADEDGYIETGWLPMGASRSNEWDPLQVGEQVVIHSESGELQNGMVGRAIHCIANPAASTRSDLYQKTFPGGGMIQYDYAAGAMKLVAQTTFTAQVGNASITMQNGQLVIAVGAATLTLTPAGFAFAGAPVTSDNTITGQAVKTAAGIDLGTHHHIAVQPGSGVSGGPA